MISFFKSLWEGVVVTSFIEWIAVISSILYVILAANRLILCWIFAFIASLLFVYLCYIGQLYVEAILQLFYVVMAIVGWFSWKSLSSDQLEIKKWKSYKHAIAILSSTLAALDIGFTFHKFTNQAHPYIDAFTTCFSLGATYMVTQKILGNIFESFFEIFVSRFCSGAACLHVLLDGYKSNTAIYQNLPSSGDFRGSFGNC